MKMGITGTRLNLSNHASVNLSLRNRDPADYNFLAMGATVLAIGRKALAMEKNDA